jgi:hypothetical protein
MRRREIQGIQLAVQEELTCAPRVQGVIDSRLMSQSIISPSCYAQFAAILKFWNLLLKSPPRRYIAISLSNWGTNDRRAAAERAEAKFCLKESGGCSLYALGTTRRLIFNAQKVRRHRRF